MQKLVTFPKKLSQKKPRPTNTHTLKKYTALSASIFLVLPCVSARLLIKGSESSIPG